jgi:hypothetical protein
VVWDHYEERERSGCAGEQGQRRQDTQTCRANGAYRFEDFPAEAIDEDDGIASASIAELDALLVRLDEGIAAERSAMDSLLDRLTARVPR